ncbi:MAG: hypothetical protein LBT66_06370 [Methanobrevibacter sp.]|nr:hypothetical protein [Candidatus Methanovirga meridionalis]
MISSYKILYTPQTTSFKIINTILNHFFIVIGNHANIGSNDFLISFGIVGRRFH